MTALVEKVVRKFRSFQEAEEADREFYRSLTGEQRVDILLELNRQAFGDELLHAPMKRVAYIRKLGEPPRD
jgi:hypothetical protein